MAVALVAKFNACPHLCQENPARKQGVAYMACHKRVACVDISPASMFPWQCVTGRDTCSKEWGGGKVTRRSPTPRNHSPLPKALKHTRTLILNFGSDVPGTPIFFFPVGRLVQYLQRQLPHTGSLVAVKRFRPGFRLMHVPKPVRSHRPRHLAFHLMEGEPQKIPRHAAFQVQGRNRCPPVVPCLAPGAPKSGFRISPCFRGGIVVFLPLFKTKGSWGCGEEVVERHSDPPWERPGARAQRLLAMVWGKSALEALGRHPPLIAQEVCSRERKGTKAEAGHWFLKQPEAPAPPSPAPPSPAEVDGTFVAWASLERSCDFSGRGTEDRPQNKICLSRAPLWHWKCGRRNYELASNGLASPPSSACGHQALWAEGVLKFCHGGLQWGVGLSVPRPVSVEGAAEGRPAVGAASRVEVGLPLHQGPCPAMRHLFGVRALGKQSSP